MHEISICQSIIHTVENEYGEASIGSIKQIHVKVGVLSCVDAMLLAHVFGFVKMDTALEKAELITEMVDVLAVCDRCGATFKVEKYRFVCPVCDAPASNIIEGKELLIHKIIFEELAHEKVNE
jgi:hydrogenase nickel incorporation protein HypA/HybF